MSLIFFLLVVGIFAFFFEFIFLVRTLHDCLCPFCWVLFIREFLAATLSLFFLADLDVSSVSFLLSSWCSFSVEGVDAFLLFGDFSISISSMMFFDSSTWGVEYGD